MFGLVLQNGKLCDVWQRFFSRSKSADKPSAAGLVPHAVRLIPRVVFALITDCFMTFSEPNT